MRRSDELVSKLLNYVVEYSRNHFIRSNASEDNHSLERVEFVGVLIIKLEVMRSGAVIHLLVYRVLGLEVLLKALEALQVTHS